MEALICHKDDFIRFPDDPLDVALAMRRGLEKFSWISKCCWSNRWFTYHHKNTSG